MNDVANVLGDRMKSSGGSGGKRNANSKVQDILNWVYEFGDISINLERTDARLNNYPNGMMINLAPALGLFAISLVTAALAWYFDIIATLAGVQALRGRVIESLPMATPQEFKDFLVIGIMLLPTLAELFTGAYAKYNIRPVQLGIIIFICFDLVTDIPVTYDFIMDFWPSIEKLPFLIDHLVFWVVFAGWLLFATLGFEVLTIVFVYAAIGHSLKCFKKD